MGSMRRPCENGLIKPGMGLALDDLDIKNARFSDFTLPENCGLFSCQRLGRILGIDDLQPPMTTIPKAVFKRLLLVNVHKPIIKGDVRKACESARKRPLADAFFAQANKRRGAASELVPLPSPDSSLAPPSQS